ncbi:uncharacterized protein LOC125325051 isoform X3 [Corvus hawaiiensis]|uniref:uncharacterized protein LOC125325051 isoform X3 n=1 Tax=Corvus hawaiiensis TaxID=134902 RepID=UPI0020199123|nr:uncharacterized protein LOC125325051 isoform X3 [Corvus hawaiiensis]
MRGAAGTPLRSAGLSGGAGPGAHPVVWGAGDAGREPPRPWKPPVLAAERLPGDGTVLWSLSGHFVPATARTAGYKQGSGRAVCASKGLEGTGEQKETLKSCGCGIRLDVCQKFWAPELMAFLISFIHATFRHQVCSQTSGCGELSLESLQLQSF